MARGGYIGVKSDTPVYTDITVTGENLGGHFVVSKDDYGFTWSNDYRLFLPDNVRAEPGSFSAIRLRAIKDMELSFMFHVLYLGTGGSFGIFCQDPKGYILEDIYIENQQDIHEQFQVSILSGDTINIVYRKGTGIDEIPCAIESITVSTKTYPSYAREFNKIYIGDEDGIARRVRKGYVGDENGIARLFYINDNRLAKEYSIGESIFLPIDRLSREFIVVHQGNPDTSIYDGSCNGTWLMQKDIYDSGLPLSSDYATSELHAHLNRDFLSTSYPDVLDAVRHVKIPYVTTDKVVATLDKGLPTRVFPISISELGLTEWVVNSKNTAPADGAKLDYFDSTTGGPNEKLQATLPTGQEFPWDTRSYLVNIASGGLRPCFSVNTDGSIRGDRTHDIGTHIRPTLILNQATEIDPETNTLASLPKVTWYKYHCGLAGYYEEVESTKIGEIEEFSGRYPSSPQSHNFGRSYYLEEDFNPQSDSRGYIIEDKINLRTESGGLNPEGLVGCYHTASAYRGSDSHQPYKDYLYRVIEVVSMTDTPSGLVEISIKSECIGVADFVIERYYSNPWQSDDQKFTIVDGLLPEDGILAWEGTGAYLEPAMVLFIGGTSLSAPRGVYWYYSQRQR